MKSPIKYCFSIIFFFFFFTFGLFYDQVLAGCTGTIRCGDMAYRCTGLTTKSCQGLNDYSTCQDLNLGTCKWLCDITLGAQMNCSTTVSPLTRPYCETATAPSSCAVGCNTSTDNPCTWTDPIPSCSLYMAPETGSISVGQTGNYSITVSNIQNGTVSVVVLTSNESIATASVTGTGPTYTLRATGVNPGTATVTARGLMDGVLKCQDSSTVTVTQPYSCSVDLQPTTGTLAFGGSEEFDASVDSVVGGTVSHVAFSSNNISIITVDPATDTTSAYRTIATGVGAGTTTVSADVIIGGASRCKDVS